MGGGPAPGPCARGSPRRRGHRRGGREEPSPARRRRSGRVVRARITLDVSRCRKRPSCADRPSAAPPSPLARAGRAEPAMAFSSASPSLVRAGSALRGRPPVRCRRSQAPPPGRRPVAACRVQPASASAWERRMACSSPRPPSRRSSPLTRAPNRPGACALTGTPGAAPIAFGRPSGGSRETGRTRVSRRFRPKIRSSGLRPRSVRGSAPVAVRLSGSGRTRPCRPC